MLNALKAASEAYLGEPIVDAEVVIPLSAPAAFYDNIRSVCSLLAVRMPLSEQLPAGILAARAYGFRGNCLDGGDDPRSDPEQLILTVEYAKAALTTQLVDEDYGEYETRRELHDTNLGLGSVKKDTSVEYKEVERAIRELTTLLLKDGNGAGIKEISSLVLLGESANDAGLHDVLEKILGQKYGSYLETSSGAVSNPATPLFAASRAVALDCLRRLKSEKEKM